MPNEAVKDRWSVSRASGTSSIFAAEGERVLRETSEHLIAYYDSDGSAIVRTMSCLGQKKDGRCRSVVSVCVCVCVCVRARARVCVCV